MLVERLAVEQEVVAADVPDDLAVVGRDLALTWRREESPPGLLEVAFVVERQRRASSPVSCHGVRRGLPSEFVEVGVGLHRCLPVVSPGASTPLVTTCLQHWLTICPHLWASDPYSGVLMSSTRRTRAEQRSASRAAILDAAISSYGDAGSNGASFRDVANSAGVTHPLVLQYFDSKDGLIAAVGERLTAHVTAEIAAAGSCDAEGFSLLLRSARDDRPMAKLLIRSALGDMSPDGFPACLGGPWSSQVAVAGGVADRRARTCQYAASSLLLGWLTFDGFMTSAVRLGNMSEQRRDQAIADVAAHLWALASADAPTLEFGRIATTDPEAHAAPPPTQWSTRETLLMSAVELFAQHGPATVSIRDIARHAGLNHGLLHRHFDSKQALVTEAIEVGVASLMPGALAPAGLDIEQVVAVMHSDPIPARLIARTLVDGIDISSVRVRYPVMDGVYALACRKPAEQRPPCVADPRIAAVATASMVGGSVIWGESLRTASGFHDDVQPALADLSHHLLGVPRG